MGLISVYEISGKNISPKFFLTLFSVNRYIKKWEEESDVSLNWEEKPKTGEVFLWKFYNELGYYVLVKKYSLKM